MVQFVVKTKMRKDAITKADKPIITWMKPEMPYAVLDIYKYRAKEGTFTTFFLMGDQDTGLLHWVDSHGVDFIGVA
jgi:hypothetical protein